MSWIKSRGKIVNILYCFIFLQNHCEPLVEHLDHEAMYLLIEKKVFKSKRMFRGCQIIKRNIERGKNAEKRWGNKYIQDIYYFYANDSCYIKRAIDKQIKYHMPTRKKFDAYKEEMLFSVVYKPL